MDPRVFFGRGGSGELLEYGVGMTDQGEPIVAQARTSRLAAAGPGGEALFTGVDLVLTHTLAGTVEVIPVVDGILRPEAAPAPIELEATGGLRVTRRFNMGLSVPHLHEDVEIFRTGLFGIWFQILVRTSGELTDGTDLIFEGCNVEVEEIEPSDRRERQAE